MTNWSKNEGEESKFVKISLIFKFSKSKLGYIEIFVKMWEKMKWKSSLTNWLYHFHYLTDEDGKKVDVKNGDEYEKIWKYECDFWILRIKIKLHSNFYEIWEKILTHFLRNFLLIKAKTKIKLKKIEKIILHIRIRLYGTFHKNQRKKLFFKIFTWERHTRTEVSKGLIL